jgi:hypothetical protein
MSVVALHNGTRWKLPLVVGLAMKEALDVSFVTVSLIHKASLLLLLALHELEAVRSPFRTI